MAKKIELYLNGESKTFHQPSRINGKAARVGLKIGKKVEELERGIPDDDLLDELLQFVAEYGYNGQFTADELEEGLDARKLFEELSIQLSSIIAGEDEDEGEGKSTEANQN